MVNILKMGGGKIPIYTKTNTWNINVIWIYNDHFAVKRNNGDVKNMTIDGSTM